MKRILLPVLLLFLLPGALLGQGRTAAGTIIRNQAKIEFQRDDTTGLVFEASSNEVLIQVLPVYGIDITPDHTDPVATPGNEAQLQYGNSAALFADRTRVTFQYLATFTGNTPDTIKVVPTFQDGISDFAPQLLDGDNGFLVYKDADENGQVGGSDVLVASWRDANLDGILNANEISVTTIGINFQPGQVVPLLITFYVAEGRSPGDQVYFGLNGSSAADPTKTDTGNISLFEVVNGPVMEIRKTGPTSIAPGGTVNYTITATNTGNAAAQRRDFDVDGGSGNYSGVMVFDVIPVNVTTGNPFTVNSLPSLGTDPTGGQSTFVYSSRVVVTGTATDPRNAAFDPTDNAWGWETTYAAGDTVIAWISSDDPNDADLSATTGVDEVVYSFGLSVPSTAASQTITNYAYAHFSDGTSSYTIEAINAMLTRVGGSGNVIIRDTDFDSHYTPATGRTSSDDGSGSTNDEQTYAIAQPGRPFYFTNRVINTGTGPDSFNITIDSANSTIPAGWRVDLLKSDGRTPLIDTATDALPDTGEIQPYDGGPNYEEPEIGQFVDIVVRVTIPENATGNGTTANPLFELVLEATSVGNSGISDPTTNIIVDLGVVSMNLANNDGGSIDEALQSAVGTTGGFVDFPLIVENKAPSADGDVDSYTLSATLPSPDWRVVYFRDTNENGVLDSNESVPQFETTEVAPQDSAFMIARVFIPEWTPADSNYTGTASVPDLVKDPYSITFRATSTNQPVCVNPATDTTCDEITNEISLTYDTQFFLVPDRNGTIEPGGQIVYEHSLRNLSDRALRIYLKLTPGTDSWQYSLLKDDGSFDPLPTAVAPDGNTYPYLDMPARVASGQASEDSFLIRLFASSDTPSGKTDVSQILALAWDPNSVGPVAFANAPEHSVYDITIVVNGDLRLTKESSVAYSTKVAPGSTITYTTTYFNKSAEPMADVIIFDPISPYTSYVRGSSSILPVSSSVTFQVSTNGGISWANDAGSGADPSITTVRVVFNSDVLPGDEGSYSFDVQVK